MRDRDPDRARDLARVGDGNDFTDGGEDERAYCNARSTGGMDLVESADEHSVRHEIDAHLLAGLADRGVECGFFVVSTPAGECHVARPGIVLGGRALDEENLEIAGIRPHDEGDRGAGKLRIRVHESRLPARERCMKRADSGVGHSGYGKWLKLLWRRLLRGAARQVMTT